MRRKTWIAVALTALAMIAIAQSSAWWPAAAAPKAAAGGVATATPKPAAGVVAAAAPVAAGIVGAVAPVAAGTVAAAALLYAALIVLARRNPGVAFAASRMAPSSWATVRISRRTHLAQDAVRSLREGRLGERVSSRPAAVGRICRRAERTAAPPVRPRSGDAGAKFVAFRALSARRKARGEDGTALADHRGAAAALQG